MFKSFSVSLWIILALASTAQGSFISENMKSVLEVQEGSLQISVYETSGNPAFYLPSEQKLSSVDDFQKQVRALTEVNPYFLLKRQRDIFSKVGFTEVLPRFELVLKQNIYEISFLEKMLLELHSERMQAPLFKSYSEFGANILEGPKGELVIIFISNAGDASVPETKARRDVLKEYLAKGFIYKINIHNHPFGFNSESDGGDIAGTTIPSGNTDYGDVSFFLNEKRNFQLQNAWITNGFSTLRIEAVDFSKY